LLGCRAVRVQRIDDAAFFATRDELAGGTAFAACHADALGIFTDRIGELRKGHAFAVAQGIADLLNKAHGLSPWESLAAGSRSWPRRSGMATRFIAQIFCRLLIARP